MSSVAVSRYLLVVAVWAMHMRLMTLPRISSFGYWNTRFSELVDFSDDRGIHHEAQGFVLPKRKTHII